MIKEKKNKRSRYPKDNDLIKPTYYLLMINHKKSLEGGDCSMQKCQHRLFVWGETNITF